MSSNMEAPGEKKNTLTLATHAVDNKSLTYFIFRYLTNKLKASIDEYQQCL